MSPEQTTSVTGRSSQLRANKCTMSAAHPSQIKLPIVSPTRSSPKRLKDGTPSVVNGAEELAAAAELDEAAAI
jgi:hypothetical protein